jgi:hypothetical protein
VCWSIVVKENPTVLHFRGCFVLTPSLRWQRTSMYIFFTHNYYTTYTMPANSCKLYLQILGTSGRYCVTCILPNKMQWVYRNRGHCSTVNLLNSRSRWWASVAEEE